MGIYRKSNLLDEVLKMYKTASKFTNPYSIGQGGDFGMLSEKKFERYYVDSFGNPVGPDYSTMDDSRAKVTNSHRTIKSPQPYHKRL